MTESEITTLAREYAEMAVQRLDMSEKQHAEAILRYTLEVKFILRLLLRRFYLIKKSEVKDMLERGKKQIASVLEQEVSGQVQINRRNGQINTLRAIFEILAYLFPEIAKEVEP